MDSTTHTTTTVEFVDWRTKAKEKLEAEDKLFKGGRAAASVQSYVLRALLNFADQEPRFAEVVCNTERTFSECCAAVVHNAGEVLSDLEAYRKAVQFYFPNTSKSSRSFTRLDEDKEKEAHDKEVYIERIDAKVQREERLPGTSVETSTTTESSYLIVERLERLLTDVQRQKSKVIQQLADLRRMSNSGKNELVDDWVAAVEAADAEVEGEDDGAETT